MYKSFFKLNETPFSITPDPRFLFLSKRHREALAHLHFSLRNSIGFVLLTGEVGTGKTTVSRCLFEQLPSNISLALIFNPRLTAQELIASICDEFEVPYDHEKATLKYLFDQLNHFLLAAYAQGKRTILVLDEAQNLSLDLLEQIRMLSNLETATDKLLQIILIGQPELIDILAQPELRQFNQRITARFHITPFNAKETQGYIHHRLTIAGCSDPLFSLLAMRMVHHYSKGIPRLVNQICDRALLGAYTLNRKQIGLRIVRQAAAEIAGQRSPRRRWRWKYLTGVAVFLAIGLFWLGQEDMWKTSLHIQFDLGREQAKAPSPTTIQTVEKPPAVLKPQETITVESTALKPQETITVESTLEPQAVITPETTIPIPPVMAPQVPLPLPMVKIKKIPTPPLEPITVLSSTQGLPELAPDSTPQWTTPKVPTPPPRPSVPHSYKNIWEVSPSASLPSPALEPTALPSTEPLRVPPQSESASDREAFKKKIAAAWSELATPDLSLNPDKQLQPNVSRMDRIFADLRASTDYGINLKSLLKLWRPGLPEPKGLPTCNYVESLGLRCVTMQSRWTSLKELGVPVMLHMKDQSGKNHYAVVNGMNKDRVTLTFASKGEELSLAEVDPFWSGNFTLVYRPTPTGKSRLVPGEKGQDIVWLGNNLTRVQAEALIMDPPDLYGPELQERIQRFQKENHLLADGISGPFTLLKLDMFAHNPQRWVPTMPGITE